MKRKTTFCAAMMAAMTAVAQTDNTFMFVDAQGNEIADGTTIVVNTRTQEGQMVVPLWVKNASGDKAAVSMYETIDSKPNGTWQTCAFGNCMQLKQTGYSPKNIVAADYLADIQTEWIPDEGQYATWEATLEIHVFNIVVRQMFGMVTEVAGNDVIGHGPKVTVRFEYQPDGQVVKGDVNGDRAVDVADISAIISVMAGSTLTDATAGSGFATADADADVNGDGTVDVADISSVITIMAAS